MQTKEEKTIKDRNEPWQSGTAKSITFIVTKDCQLACKYCYLVGKNAKERMPWEVAKQAIEYDEEDPKHYWNTRLNGTYVRVAARNAAIQMAIHDELFYQMAMQEGIELTDEEEKSYRMTEQDFWGDMVDAEKDIRLGVTEQDIAETMHKIALAQKYQEIYAALQNGEKDDYNFSEEAYKQLLEKQKYKINEKVWKRVSFGTITLDYQEEN